MNLKNKHITILGAGLSGLTLAYLLKKSNYNITVIEARNRLGGRVFTKKTVDNTPIDLGPAWLWNQNTALLNLLEELEIPLHEQVSTGNALFQSVATQPPQEFKLPQNQEPNYRMVNGTHSAIEKLATVLESSELKLEEPVLKLQEIENQIEITTSKTVYRADFVISTIPPRLLINSIEFTPSLPQSLIDIANETHTWMADSIKFGLSYNKPFWKEKGFSGSCFSNIGPFTELYDHTNYAENKFALAGFMSGTLTQELAEFRKEKIINQLELFLGEEALEFTSYEEQCWAQEKYTHIPYQQFIAPHKNNGHSVYNQLYMNNKILLAGTETSSQYAGYMEGAVRRANSVFDFIKLEFK